MKNFILLLAALLVTSCNDSEEFSEFESSTPVEPSTTITSVSNENYRIDKEIYYKGNLVLGERQYIYQGEVLETITSFRSNVNGNTSPNSKINYSRTDNTILVTETTTNYNLELENNRIIARVDNTKNSAVNYNLTYNDGSLITAASIREKFKDDVFENFLYEFTYQTSDVTNILEKKSSNTSPLHQDYASTDLSYENGKISGWTTIYNKNLFPNADTQNDQVLIEYSGNRISKIIQNGWNTLSEKWVSFKELEYTYDNNGYLIELDIKDTGYNPAKNLDSPIYNEINSSLDFPTKIKYEYKVGNAPLNSEILRSPKAKMYPFLPSFTKKHD